MVLYFLELHKNCKRRWEYEAESHSRNGPQLLARTLQKLCGWRGWLLEFVRLYLLFTLLWYFHHPPYFLLLSRHKNLQTRPLLPLNGVCQPIRLYLISLFSHFYHPPYFLLLSRHKILSRPEWHDGYHWMVFASLARAQVMAAQV